MVKRFLEGASLPAELRDCRWWTYFSPHEQQQILQGSIVGRTCNEPPFGLYEESMRSSHAPDLLSRELHVSLKHLSQGIIVKVDRMSMANSLNVRMPFLDYGFVDFAMGLHSDLKIRFWKSKWILKKSMVDSGALPRGLLRKGKRGFTIPMKLWLRGDLRDELEQLLSETSLRRYFNHEWIRKLMQSHLAGDRDNSHKLWTLMLFSIWHSMYIDGGLDSSPSV